MATLQKLYNENGHIQKRPQTETLRPKRRQTDTN